MKYDIVNECTGGPELKSSDQWHRSLVSQPEPELFISKVKMTRSVDEVNRNIILL